MILDVHTPERQEHCTSSPPHQESGALCQNGTPASDTVSHPEVTNWHGNQTKGKQIQRSERSSNDSTAPQKGRDFPVVTQATRNEQQQEANTHTHVCEQAERKGTLPSTEQKNNDTTVPSSRKPNNSSPSHGTQATAAGVHAKQAYDAKAKQTQQQVISQATGIPQRHLEEMEIAQTPKKRPIPDFIRNMMSHFSRELGDSSTSTKSNITRAAKLYFFALDYIKDAQDDPQGFFSDLLYEAKQAAYKVNCIRYRGANNRPNRMPVFFTCLENLFELRDEELDYIRSDEPLFERAW
jgi:hypothetical protein